jgi:Uma2 family endonuclease
MVRADGKQIRVTDDWENVESSICFNLECGSKETDSRDLQEKKLSGPITSTEAGIRIDLRFEYAKDECSI